MADGRKIPYIIEMIADDTTLRNQMKKWDWEDIMGSKGKGFADILGQEGKEAKEKIEDALMKLNLDWAKIFGMDKLEAALSRTFKKSKIKIESSIVDIDTNKLKTTIEFIEGLGNAFEKMNAKFDAGSAARSLSPLLGTLEQMPEEAERVKAAFSGLYDKLDKKNKPIVITPSFDFAKTDKDVEDLKRRLNDLDKKVSIKIGLDDDQVSDKVDEIVYHVGEVNDKIKKLQEELDAPETTKEREREVRVELAKQLSLRTDYYRTIAKMKKHYGKVVDDVLLGEDDFKGLNLTKEIKKSKEQITNLINEVSSTSSAEQNNAIHIGVALPTAEDIRSAVNAEVIKLNKRKDALQSVKIQIDPTRTSVDDDTLTATTTEHDDNFIQNINKRFDAISKAIKTRQDEIVTQTKDVWRKEILQQLKFRSSDFEFNFGDALIEGLQTALDEADFKVNIDTEFLANQIKSIVENTNISLGAGTANINKESMTAAVMAGVRAALFGEQMVATTSSPASDETVEGVEHIAKETEDVAKRLDIAEDYVKDVVEKIKAIAKYAVKPEDKDSPGAKATRDRFSLLGLDLTQVKNAGNDDAKIASILEKSLLANGSDGQLVGKTVIDELSGFKGSSSKTIPAFLKSLHEVFFMLQESTQSVEEWTRINKSREILDNARKKAQDAVALLDVRKTIKNGEVPTIAEIDELTSTMEPYLEQIAKRSLSYSGKKIEDLAQEKRKANPSLDFGKSIEEARREIYEQILSSFKSSFADLRTAREILGDKTDSISMTEFQSAADDFYKSSTKLFVDLKKQAEDMFKGEIYLQHGKNGYLKKRDINSYKQLASIKDDDVIVDIRVTSSLNNVAIGETKTEYDEKRLMRGQRADYLVDKTYEEDILRRQLKYKGFKPQGSSDIPVNIEASIEGMQKRIAKADEDIPKLQEQIKLLDKEVEIKRQEAKAARAFLESIINNPNATATERREANTADMHAYGKLYDVISARGALTRQVDDLRASQERANNLIEQLKLTDQYNNLLTKSLELEGSIIKLEKDDAPQKEIKKRKKELSEIHTQLTDIKSAADAFGGLYQQSIGKEYSASERKTYALEQLKLIDNDLITARAQKSVINARVSKKDREIAEVDKYGLGAGIGARELGREKGRITSEFIQSDYVKELIEEAREQTKDTIAKAVSESQLREDTVTKEFNAKIENAMIRDGLNPYSGAQTQDFLKTERGKQYLEDHNSIIDSIREELAKDTKDIWDSYDKRVKGIRSEIMAEFKANMSTDNGVLRYMSKTKTDAGEWVSEIVEVDVREALNERLEEERRILKEQLDGDTKSGKPSIQTEIERLESDRRIAINYGGVGDEEILSADIIKDQILKQTELDELLDKRIDKEKALKDLEAAGISEDDQSVKHAQKELTNLDKEIAMYEMLVRNREKLIKLRWDESKADSYTAEEKELHFTEQVVNYNRKIEDSLVRQKDVKEKLNSATEEEKTKLQYQLDQERAKVEKWRQDIATLEGKIQKISNERIGVAGNGASSGKSDGSLTNVIKKISGVDNVDNAKLSEIAEILNSILNVLTGGNVVEGSARSEVDVTKGKKNQTRKYAEDTLSKILKVLNALKSDGVKMAGKKQGEGATKAKEPKIEKTEAELIKERALKDKDAVLGIAGSSKLKSSYQRLVDELTKATELGVIKKLAQQASALGFNIMKDSANWDMKVAQSDKIFEVNKNFGGINKKTGENKLKTNMENLAGKHAKEEHSQYEFLNFDGKQLTYQLTNIKGEVRKVTMEWSELNNQVAITSDKSVSKLDDLAGKIENFGNKFKDAINEGYLDKNDEGYKRFLDQIETIKGKIENGESFGKVNAARGDAIRIADELAKKVAKNKNLYAGTTEIRAVEKKRTEIDARNPMLLERKDLDIVNEYNDRYNDLIKTYEKFKRAGTLPKHQKELQAMAIKVKDLGTELEKSVGEAERLKELAKNSAFHNGKQMGGIKQVSAEETRNLETTMKSYLKTLGLGNVEHIKYDRISQTLTGTLRKNNKAVETLKVKYNDATKAIYAFAAGEKESLTGVPAFVNGFKKKFNSIMQYLTMTMSIHRVFSELRRGIQYLKEIDLALTELRKVTDKTEEEYDQFLRTAATTGNRLGATISAVTEATATFAKLGYSMEQATEMAESAIVYKNVGDNIASTEDAANSIISTMKGFRLEASESMAIVDRFNEVGNRFAITSQGIGEALRLSASALSEGGNSLDESIGLITAANEVVNDPSSVGTALKTLTLRLRGSKTELEEMGEDVSDMATTTSQLQAKLLALTGGKVDIMLDANTFKNSTQILREMADAWEDMTDIQRASALELMGGKRQANTLSALIQNFDTVEKVIETSAKSAGSALKENERYLDSIQGKIDQFNNSVQAMWSNTLDSDDVKGVVELGTELVKIIDNLGLVKTLVMAIGTYLIQKNFKGNLFGGIFDAKSIDDAKMHLQSLKDAYEKAEKAFNEDGSNKNKKRLNKAKNKYDKYDAKVSPQVKEYDEINKQLIQAKDNLADYQKKLDNYTGNSVKRRAKLQADVDKAQANVDELNGKLKNVELQAQKTGVVGATAGQKIVTGFKAGIKTVWSFGKQLIASFATMYAITAALEVFGKIGEGISYVWDEYIEGETAAEAKEKFEELNNELSETTSQLNSLESELDDTNDRIEELLSQDSLTLVEQDELKKLQSSTSELERQIELTKELQKLQQTSVNTASLNAMDKYTAGTSFYSEKSKTEREEEAKETGNTIGNVAGLIIGGVIGSFIAPGAGTMVGAGIGSAILSPLLGAGFAAGESSSYGSEMTVEEALDRMATDTKKFKEAERAAHEAYAKSNSEEDKQRWIEASQALNDYQNNLATSISQIQAYINSIDYSALTDPSEKQEYLDALDDTLAYAIIQGVQGAERLAIESIFSEKLITEDAQALMDAITSALKFNEDVDFMDFEDEKFDAIKTRLAGVGLTVTDLIYHFTDLKEKAEASLLIEPEDMIKPISELSSAIGELKSAFDEFNESGMVTAETLMKLSETFGELDGWKGFVDLAGSGVATVEEMENSINLLVEDLATKKIDNPFQLGYDDPTTDINEAAEAHKSYWMTIAQLQELGITNAKELVDAMQQKAVAKAITNEIDAYDKLYEKQAAGEKLTEDEQKLLSDYATREDYKKHLIEEYKVKYGLNELSAENLALIDEQIDKQMQLSEQSEKIAKIDKLKGESFTGDNSLLAKFQKSLELTDDVIEKYSKIREEYSALDEAVKAAESAGYNKDHPLLDTILDWAGGEGWGNLSYDAFDDSLKELFTLGLANTDLDNYDNLVNARNEKLKELYGVSDEVIAEIQNRQDLFKQLTDIASEYEIDLSGIDLTAFDATDTGDNSVFKQVYNTVYKALYGENGEGGLMAEWKATEEQIKKDLGTAFDAIGLEVTLELQDKDKLVDDIQSVYDELLNAQKEYAENGHVSVDTMQSLLKLEPKYLDLLVDENGNLNLTKENLHAVARARITDLGLKQQNAIVDQALALATNGSMQALNEWIIVNETADESMKDSISTTKQLILAALKAREATGELPEGYADNFMGILENQLSAVQRVTDLALSDLDNTLSTSGNTAAQEANDAFQDAMDYWENRIGAKESQLEQVQNEIDMLEATGKKANAGYFTEQLDLLAGDGGKLELLNNQLAEAEVALAGVPEGSEDWWTIANTINGIHNEIDQTTMAVQDLKDAMADTHWYMFDEAHDRVSTLTSDLENIRDILSHEEFFDDEGNFTKEGLGYLATYVNDLGVFEGALAHAKTELDLFRNDDGELSYDPNKQYVDAFGNDLSIDSEQDFYDAVEKAEGVYDDLNNKVIETRYNIKDLYEQQIDAIEEYTQTLVENYNEYTDAVKEALDSERDLYEFKKSTEQKSKNIASIERRIASLSGSTNAADVAERRKLQAELTDAKSDMDDHYYSHAKEQQSQALDEEATAYETAMNAYIEGLRTKLEEGTAGLYMSYEEMGTETKSFIDGVTASVVLNAGNVKQVYEDTGETIDDCLMTPWTNAAAAIGAFASSEGALGLMNSWTEAKAGKPFYDFQTKVSSYLSKPWSSIIGTDGPVQTFKTSVTGVMSQIVSSVQTNVSGISGVISGLQSEIDKIKDTTIRITTVYDTQGTPPGGGSGNEPDKTPNPTMHVEGQLFVGTAVPTLLTSLHKTVNGVTYVPIVGTDYYVKKDDAKVGWAPYGTKKYKYYAKGTTGTTRDEWAITDEPQFGDELVLVPGKDGNLSFMRKGTGVVPADMTQKLFELAQIPTSDLMSKNLTAVVPNITKNDFKNEFNFESLVHVDTVDSDTLPKLEKMVDKKIDDFSKALNYSLKRFAR